MKVTILKKEEIDEPTSVFDIEIENEHHYILEDGIISHNSGPKYVASTIIELSKTKEKESTTSNKVIGALIRCKSVKNRLARENEEISVVINYDRGLSRYSGLFDLGIELGVIEHAKTENPTGEKLKQGWYRVKGVEKQLRKGDFAKDHSIWDRLLSDGFGDMINNKFKYRSHAEGVIDEDVENMDEIDEEIEEI